MRINPEVKQKRIDAFGEVRIPNCEPQQLKVVAERLMKMLIDREEELDATPYRYNTVTELDKQLVVDYWQRYDYLRVAATAKEFKEWYMAATNASDIERATRWLRDHRYIFLKPEVEERAQQSAAKYSKAVKNKH